MPAKGETPDGPTEKVKGPASYFPSIERTYGRPIEEWQDLIRASDLEKHMEARELAQVRVRDGSRPRECARGGHARRGSLGAGGARRRDAADDRGELAGA